MPTPFDNLDQPEKKPRQHQQRSDTMTTYPTVDESRQRLQTLGWIVGETGGGSTWLVTATNGDHRIHAEGASQSEAWWRACVQAREMCLVAPAPEGAPIDEATWLASSDPMRMLAFLRGQASDQASDRKLRLFAVACCQRIAHLMKHTRSLEAVDAAERYADGLITKEELAAAAARESWPEAAALGSRHATGRPAHRIGKLALRKCRSSVEDRFDTADGRKQLRRQHLCLRNGAVSNVEAPTCFGRRTHSIG